MFTSIVKYRSITQAAQQLCVTKAAVSIALQTLEEQLAQPLFDRVKNRLLLNAQGMKLLPMAEELLARMQSIETLFNPQQLTGVLRIGASITIGNHLLPSLLADFMTMSECQRPTLNIANTANLIQCLYDYQLDIALVEGFVANNDLVVLPWIQDEMHVVASARFSEKRCEEIIATNYNDQKWVLREPKSGTREQFDHQVAPYLKQWSLGLEFNSNEAVISAVASGIGLGFMSNLSVADAFDNKRLIKMDSKYTCTRQLYLVYLKGRYISPLLQSFIEFVKESIK